jgi:dipeptidase D
VVLQSHLDMVHQKNTDTDFDFETEGIKMYVDGDWVKADGTTLGADNGIGVAAIMTILAADDIAHPPLEALLTMDEETGMTGAQNLKGGILKGKIMLNLDTEDDDELTIGCAGGVDVTVNKKYQPEPSVDGMAVYQIHVKGLTGGHSGMDIHLGRANANKLMNRILWHTNAEFGLRISSIKGGSLRNAIPRESFSTVIVESAKKDAFEKYMQSKAAEIKTEYKTTDPDMEIGLEKVSFPSNVLPVKEQEQLLASLYAVVNGIYRMSPDMEGLVQTSSNLALVNVADGTINVQFLTRGSVDSEKMDMATAIKAAFKALQAEVTFEGAYPGWAPAPDSQIVTIMSDLYGELFNDKANVSACHAGLECGILGTNYPWIQMISFGPNIRGAHSPDEKTQISSVQKFWGYLLETLKRIPEDS